MKRTKWKFPYTGKSLAAAAGKQREHRQERFAWWTKRKDEVMAEIKAKGLTIEEGNAGRMGTADNDKNYNYTVSLRGPQVVVNHELQVQLTEAQQRINIHREAIREYTGWIEVFDAHPDKEMLLNHDDWLYFLGTVVKTQ